MFSFFRFFSEGKSKKSCFAIIDDLQVISKRCDPVTLIVIDTLLKKLHNNSFYNPKWKDVDSKINSLISRLTYNINDNNAKTISILLQYIEKLVDSRIGFSNYHEKLKNKTENELQGYHILMNEQLDKEAHALEKYRTETDATLKAVHDNIRKMANADAQQTAKIILDLSIRVSASDLDAKQRISDAQNVTEQVEKDTILMEYYDSQIDNRTADNITISQGRYERRSREENPASAKSKHTPPTNRVSPKISIEEE